MKKIVLLIILIFLITPSAKGVISVLSLEGFPLTVTSSTTVIVEGKPCLLNVGQRLMGFSSVPMYKAVLENSREVLVPAGNVEDPVIEYLRLGAGSYISGSYETAVALLKKIIAVDPSFAEAYLWLAKSYNHLADYQAAYQAIAAALRIDKADEACKLFAQQLGGRYFDIGRAAFKASRYPEALENYQKVVELKPDSDVSWIELGKCYQRLGLTEKAYSAWAEALRANPDARDAYILLGTKYYSPIAAKPKTKALEPTLSPELADESLSLVKMGRTNKGTPIKNALESLLTLTKSFGEQAIGKGWDVKMNEKNIFVSYVVEKGNGTLEAFEWQVDSNTKQVSAHNENARLLMQRW